MSAQSISSLSIELLYATSYRHNIWLPVTSTTAETMESCTLDWIESPQTMAMAKGSLLRKPAVERSLD